MTCGFENSAGGEFVEGMAQGEEAIQIAEAVDYPFSFSIMGDHYPAMTLVEVKGLVERGALMEIEGVALFED
jgi:enamine deaminase RidA (YjgF/YER057c/UK114 family)